MYLRSNRITAVVVRQLIEAIHMFRHRVFLAFLLLMFAVCSIVCGQGDRRIIYLSWKNVVDRSLKDNLSLKSKSLDYDVQNLETWKSLTYFMPSLNYQGSAQKYFEIPIVTLGGQSFPFGVPYTYQHSLNLTLPLFTGGSRWFNYSIQKNIRKSLNEELQGKEEETVSNSMQAYYGIMLADGLAKSAQEAVAVAKQNLDQVQKFYNAGAAKELDYQRAKAQYSSTLPVLESALANKQLSAQRLKSLLDIPLTDSLVVSDSLERTEFLNRYSTASLEDFKTLSKEHRNDIKALEYQKEAVGGGQKMALSQFAPTIAIVASVAHTAMLDYSNVSWSDYNRSQAIVLSLSWPLFDGGRSILDWQIAKIKSDQMDLLVKQAHQGTELDVEQNYYHFIETSKSLQSLKDALDQFKESLRISNVLYAQGMSNQLDVLNAQLLYTKSEMDYLQGVYSYNVSQLALLKSAGVLDTIWK